MKVTVLRWLFVLITCAITLEFKFDKHFRQFSKSIIPEGLVIPYGFEKKFYYYPSDVLIFILFFVCLWKWKKSIFEFFTQCGAYALFAIIFFGVISIYYSSLSVYPLPYIRLWQLLGAFLLFISLVSLNEAEKITARKWILRTLVVTGAFESVVAITQYSLQHSLGLRWLGELPFTSTTNECFFSSDQGKWIFDHWTGSTNTLIFVQRVMGTFSHPNVLGGFLFVTSLITLFLFAKKTGRVRFLLALLFISQSFGLILTYSRAGFFALILGISTWVLLTLMSKKSLPLIPLSLLLFTAGTIVWFVVGEQIGLRGGFFNTTKLSRDSDDLRIAYQKAAFKMIEANPLTGVGYGQFTYHLSDYLDPEYDPEKLKSAVHSIYLLLASEMGIFALLSFLCFIGNLFWRFLKSVKTEENSIFFSVLLGLFFIGGCDHYLILFQEGRLLLFLSISLLAMHLEWNRAPEYSKTVPA